VRRRPPPLLPTLIALAALLGAAAATPASPAAAAGPAAAAAASAAAAATGPAAAAAPSPLLVRTRDVRIPGSPGATLDARVYLPPAGTGTVHPLVVLPASWSVPKDEYELIARVLATKGYVAISYTARGWYLSTGEIMVAGPEDQADVTALVDWALANTPVTPGTKVGTFGVSYGAGIGLGAATVDPRIGAVVALSGWTDLQTSLLPGNTVSGQAVALLGVAARLIGRPGELLDDALDAAATGDVARVVPLAETRSPGRRVAQLNANRTAVLIGNGWQDAIFPPDQFWDSWDRLTAPKRLLLGPGDHAINEAGGIVGLPNEYVEAGYAWLDRHLLGAAGPATPAVQVRPTVGGAALGYPSLAAMRAGTRRLHLGPPSGPADRAASLTAQAPGAWSAGWTGGRESGADTGIVLATGLSYAAGLPTRDWMPLLDRAGGQVWQTAPLTAATRLAGLPAVTATLTPGAAKASAVAYLYDVDAAGVGTLLSWQPWTATGLTPGRAVTASIRLQPVVHTVRAGHRVALVLDSTEQRYRMETTAGQRVTIGAPSTLDLPLGS
jgi:dienelactone hydrolase